MKKKLLFSFLCALFCEYSIAQIRVPGKTKIAPRIDSRLVNGGNLLDDPDFKKVPIAFEPLQPDVRRGYDPEKIYTWTDPSNPRKKYSAKGKDILAQVNEVEKSLNERGHSLREKKPFIQLNLTLPSIAKNDFSKCVITNRISRDRVAARNSGEGKIGTIPWGRVSNRRRATSGRRLADVIYTYTGSIVVAREVRQGVLSNTYFLDRKGSSVYAYVMMSIGSSTYQRISYGTLDLSETEGGSPVTSVKMDIRKPDNVVSIDKDYPIEYVDCEKPGVGSGSFPLQIYTVNVSSGGYTFPQQTKTQKLYYATFKFYDAAGNEISTDQPNSIVLNNQLPMPINVNLAGQKTYNGFDYELLDPGIHAFGFFVNSGGFNSSYTSAKKGYDGIDKSVSLSGDMSMGVKYFNFKHLVSSSAPLSEEFVVFGYKFKSEKKYSRADGVPSFNNGGVEKNPDYGVVTLMNEEFDLRSTDQDYFEKAIKQELLAFRFFIGPIPCSIDVNVSGKASIKLEYEGGTGSSCKMKVNVNPHADVNLNASGGVDAFSIAYAKVVAGINLLTFDMPYAVEANADGTTADIKPSLTVGGLSGQIYFQAGLCIPIPFVDDICTDFRVDILNWNGLQKSLTVDPVKGIAL